MRPRSCLPLLAIAAVFLPATAPPNAFAGPLKHAPKEAPKPPRAPADEPAPPPPVGVPRVEYEMDRDGVVAKVHLEPLRADVVSVVIVAEPLPAGSGEVGNASPISCSGSKVIREIDAAVFAEAPLRGPDLALPVLLGAPELEESKLYAVRVCARDTTGALEGADTDPGKIVSFSGAPVENADFGSVVATPSGPVAASLLTKGFAVIGYDVDKNANVIEHVHSVRTRDSSRVSIEVEGIGEITSTSSRAYYVPSKKRFVDVGSLGMGDEVFTLGGNTAKVTRPAAPSEHLDASDLVVDGAGNYFARDVLVRDAKPAKGDATHFDSHDEYNTWTAAPMSFDCMLSSTLIVNELPSDAKSVVLVVKEQKKHPGERLEISCEKGRTVAELPRKLFERVKGERLAGSRNGPVFRIEMGSEDQGSVDCEKGYAMLACFRNADGALAPLESTEARYGMAGSSCFVAGTPIATPEGDEAIESLAVGERIYGYDVEGHRLGTVRVEHVTPRTKYDIGTVMLSNGGELRVTSEHPFFVKGLGFVAARDLEIGDRLLQQDGSEVRIERILPFDEEGEVYDVSVDGPHDYFAGGVLVHNY